MHRLATVRVRVTLAAVLIVGFALGVGGVLLVRTHRAQLTGDIETAARLRSRDIATGIANGDFDADPGAPNSDGSFAQVVGPHDQVVAASANIGTRPRISRLKAPPDGVARETVDSVAKNQARFRVIARRAHYDGTTYTVYVARSLEPVDDSEDTLIGLLAAGLPLLLLVVGLTTWFVVGRALHPVDAIREEVEAIGVEDLHRRVPEPDTEDEIGRLARTMNAMLARLEDATMRQRWFVADASHELRTPLTSIRAQLEVDLAHPERADWQATERAVLDDTVQLQRLVTDLLALATITSESAAESRRDLVDLDDIVLAEARRARATTSVGIDTTGVSGAQVEGNGDELARVVRNLLDNAVRHAASSITVGLEESDDEARLRVADDGPGIEEADQERIFERFARLDDARDRDTGGTGLGLAITYEVVLAHGGSIDVTNHHGACFTVRLPRVPGRGS